MNRAVALLERNAKKAVSASELEAWATRLVAQHPGGYFPTSAELGTNIPPQPLKLAPALAPNVCVYPADISETTERVRVWWGSGFLGQKGFSLGATNFAGPGHMWAPGVFFYQR